MELYTTKEILGIWTRNKVQIAVNQGRLSIQHCVWTTSNTQKRMNTGQRYFKNNTRKKEYWPLHFIQENRLWKNTVSSNESIEVDTASWAWWDIIIIDYDSTLWTNIFYETDQRYQHQGQSSDHRYKEIDWDEETYGEYE